MIQFCSDKLAYRNNSLLIYFVALKIKNQADMINFVKLKHEQNSSSVYHLYTSVYIRRKTWQIKVK